MIGTSKQTKKKQPLTSFVFLNARLAPNTTLTLQQFPARNRQTQNENLNAPRTLQNGDDSHLTPNGWEGFLANSSCYFFTLLLDLCEGYNDFLFLSVHLTTSTICSITGTLTIPEPTGTDSFFLLKSSRLPFLGQNCWVWGHPPGVSYGDVSTFPDHRGTNNPSRALTLAHTSSDIRETEQRIDFFQL